MSTVPTAPKQRFHAELHVQQRTSKDWVLTRPLVWEGDDEYLAIRSGFVTDFASIPKVLRWLLDNSGRNAKAAVLHDALWRESKRKDVVPRIDAWDADSIFRSALRETGSIALTRALMWFGVRTAAMVQGRFGLRGPKRASVKVAQVSGVFGLGVLTALGPTIVVTAALVVYWAASWIAAFVWRPFERRYGVQTNWPWPSGRDRTPQPDPSTRELLLVVAKDSEQGRLFGQLLEATNDKLVDAELDRFAGA